MRHSACGSDNVLGFQRYFHRRFIALDEGVATKTHVLKLLRRLVDGKTTGSPGLDTPQALTLRPEPKANVERYDGLRNHLVGGRNAS